MSVKNARKVPNKHKLVLYHHVRLEYNQANVIVINPSYDVQNTRCCYDVAFVYILACS